MSERCQTACPVIADDRMGLTSRFDQVATGSVLPLHASCSVGKFDEDVRASEQCSGPVFGEVRRETVAFPRIARLLGRPATRLVQTISCGRIQN